MARPLRLARTPWAPRWILATGVALEASVLLALIAASAAGVFAGGDDELHPPIPLRAADAPALAALVTFVGARLGWRRAPWWLRRVPPFVPFAALVVGLAAAAHPDPELGPLASFVLGLVAGLLIATVGMPMASFAEALQAAEPRPWRELHAAIALVTLGSLGAAAAGGAALAGPTIALGLARLARGIREDARDALHRRTSRAGALARLGLGLVFAPLGVGLLIVTTAMSLRLWAPP